MPKKVVVIGAGCAGLSAAAYLGKAGYSVTVLEKNGWVGGRMQTDAAKGYRFDLGPSWYWMPDIFDGFFRDFGHQTEDFYRLKRLDPSYRIHYPSGFMDIPVDRQAQIALFERLEPSSGPKLEALLNQTESIQRG